MVDLTSRITGAESSGNPFARNPRSSAAGLGGFIDKTWLETLKRHRPDLAAGKSDAELLRLKFDSGVSRAMTSAYAADNQNFLRSRGVEPSDGNTYLAHWAGPGGAVALHANPQATVEATLGRNVVNANPFMRGKTGQDAIDWAAGKMSPAQHMAANLRQRFAGQPMGTSTEGGVTEQAPTQEVGSPTDRLKAALAKYDQDWVDTGKGLQKRGQEIATSYGNRLGAYGGAGVAALGGFLEGMEGAEKKAHDEEFSRQASDASNTEGLMNVMLSSSDPAMRSAGIELKAKLLTPKSTEWVPTADGRAVVNKATGEVRQTGIEKERTPTELERRAVAGGLQPGTAEYESYVLGGPPKSKTEKWNEGQSKSANFGHMMTQAEALIAGMGPKDAAGKPLLGPDGQPLPVENPKGVLGAVRDSLVPFEGLRNVMTPQQQQTYDQAAAQWIRAKLRKESGAAIGDEEMAKEFRTYFPQYGDGPEVIKQKAAARADATRGMIAESSGAYQHFFGGEKGASDSGGDPDAPRPVRTETIDPASGQPRQGGGSAPAPQQTAAPPSGGDPYADALTAIGRGASRDAVLKRLQERGFDPQRLLELEKERQPAPADPVGMQPGSIGLF